MIVLTHTKPVDDGVEIVLSCTTCNCSESSVLAFNEPLQRYYMCRRCNEITFVRPSGFASDFCTFKSVLDFPPAQGREQLHRERLVHQAKRGSAASL